MPWCSGLSLSCGRLSPWGKRNDKGPQFCRSMPRGSAIASLLLGKSLATCWWGECGCGVHGAEAVVIFQLQAFAGDPHPCWVASNAVSAAAGAVRVCYWGAQRNQKSAVGRGMSLLVSLGPHACSRRSLSASAIIPPPLSLVSGLHPARYFHRESAVDAFVRGTGYAAGVWLGCC